MEQRITIDRLWFEFGKDELYGEEFPGLGETKSIQAVESILKAIGFNKTGFRLEPWCRKCIPGNDYPPLTLALVLCGMDELNTFLPGEKEPTGWKYESFSKNFRDDLEINLNDLKYLMRRRELPLPVSLFPTEQGNTEEAIRLDEKEYSEAFAEFAAISDIERGIAEWEVMNPTSITEKDLKERKLAEMNSILQQMKPGSELDSINPISNVADEDMKEWAQEEYWPKAIAISRVVSSRREDMNTMKARVRNLLAKLSMPSDGKEEGWEKQTESVKQDGIVYVYPTAWLMWCDKKGFTAAPTLWNAIKGDAAFQRKAKVVTLETEIANTKLNLSSLDPSEQDYIPRKREADKALATLLTDKAALMGQSSEGLGVFKNKRNLAFCDLTVSILRKNEDGLFDRVRIEGGGWTRTVTCQELGLSKKTNGLLNREGQMLECLCKKTVPANIKSHGQAVKKLRKIFREIIGTQADPFHPKSMGWQPRFRLKDAIEEADNRLASKALSTSERIKRSKKDEADEWLEEYDKKLPS